MNDDETHADSPLTLFSMKQQLLELTIEQFTLITLELDLNCTKVLVLLRVLSN